MNFLKIKKIFLLSFIFYALSAIVFFVCAESVFAQENIIQSASEYDYPPFSIVNENGEADGFSVELLRAALSEVGFGVEFYAGLWADIKEDLASGTIQTLPLVGRTPEREAIYDFTVPYISIYGAVFTLNNNEDINHVEDLKTKNVVVMKGDNAEEYALREKISDNILSVDTYANAFRFLSEGKYDAVIAQEIVGKNLLNDFGIDNVIVKFKLENFKQDFTFAVREGDNELLALLNEGLSKAIANGVYKNLSDKWLLSEKNQQNDNLKEDFSAKTKIASLDAYNPSVAYAEIKFFSAFYWIVGVIFFFLLILFILNGLNVINIGKNAVFGVLGMIILIVVVLFVVDLRLIKKEFEKNEIKNFIKNNYHISELQANKIKTLFDSFYDELLFLANFSTTYSSTDEEISKILKESFSRKKDYVYAAYRIDRNGIIANMYPVDLNSINQDVSEQAHMKKIQESMEPVVSDVFDAVEGFQGVTIHFPVIKGGFYDGTVAYLIDLDSFIGSEDVVEKLDDNQSFYIVDNNSKIIKSNKKETAGKKISEIEETGLRKEAIEELKKESEAKSRELEINGLIKIVTVYPFKILNNKWLIYSISDKQSANVGTIIGFRRMEIFSFVSIILILLTGFMFNVLITKTLRREVGQKTALLKRKLKEGEKINLEKEHLLKKQERAKKLLEEKNSEINELLKKTEIDRENLKKQKEATLNILEDVKESGLRLREINFSLEKKRTELEILRSLGVDLASVLDADEAIRVFNKHLEKAINFAAVTYVIAGTEEEGGLFYASYLKKRINDKCFDRFEEDIIRFFSVKARKELAKTVKLIKNIKPQIFGKKPDNQASDDLKKSLIYPLAVGENILGAIQIILEGEEDDVSANNDFIEAMFTNFSLSVSRLQTIAKSQHSRTGSLIESLSDGVIMFGSEKNIILVNSNAEKYTKISSKDLSLTAVFKLFKGLDLAKGIEDALIRGKFFHAGEAILDNQYFEIFIIPVKDIYGKIMSGAIIMHDITSLKKVDKMKTEFVSVASHQLRTPLTAIKLFTDMLINQEVGKLNKGQAEYLSNIHESTERMVRLVNDLLNVTRIESGRLRVTPEPTDMVAFVNSVIAEAKPLAENKKTKVSFTHDKKLPEIPLDQNLMRQVVQNFLSNAIRYSREKNGLVQVELKKKDSDFLQLMVKDNGIGIPTDVQDRIFEKFFRADNAIKSVTEGTGLGLYVSKMIIESSGGQAWFESQENKGTAFYFNIPLTGMREKTGERGMAIS